MVECMGQKNGYNWLKNVGLNAIAHFCAKVYGSHITTPQGLGTGQLFTDNITMPLEIKRDELWAIK